MQNIIQEPPITGVAAATAGRLFKEDTARALASVSAAAPKVTPFQGGMLTFPVVPFGLFFIPDARGCKYGFSNLFPENLVYHFRRNSFGNMRDLMESPPEAKLEGLVDLADEDNGVLAADQDAKTAPVLVVFTSRGGTPNISPIDTNSQNLSRFATSSQPYFDGESRERDIINDPPPDLTDRTTIEEAVQQIIDGDATS
jgi:hypothetical protein